jgi:hypothetical protein
VQHMGPQYKLCNMQERNRACSSSRGPHKGKDVGKHMHTAAVTPFSPAAGSLRLHSPAAVSSCPVYHA